MAVRSVAINMAVIEQAITPMVEEFTPTEGATITLANTPQSRTVLLNAAGPLNTVYLNVPANALSQKGQLIDIQTTYAIANLVIDQIGGGATLRGFPDPAELQAGDSVPLKRLPASNTWKASFKS